MKKEAEEKMNKLFWFFSKKAGILDFKKNKHDIIHQTLALGSVDDVKELFRKYSVEEIRKEFQKPIKGIYQPAILELFQHLLKVRLKNKSQYIKNIYGKIAS